MPAAPMKPCSKTGCRNLTRERYCSKHIKENYSYDRYRGSSSRRGYDSKWREARLGYLNKHPLCVHCMRQERVTVATVVDHIKPHKGDKELFWSLDNWQPLCKKHHDKKTATEEGGAWH